jgi:hypothetical protein
LISLMKFISQKLGCDRFNFKYLLNISPAHQSMEFEGAFW